MIKNSFLKLAVLLCVVMLLGACGGQPTPPPFECKDAIGCVAIPPDAPVKLGVLQALSGGAAPIGTTQVNIIKMILDKQDNKFLGHPVELLTEDELCSPEGGANAALKVVADPQVVAVLGTTCSNAATTASKIVSEAGMTMISGVNTAPSLTAIGQEKGADWQPGYFRTVYNGAVISEAAATFAIQGLGLTKAATINDGDAFSQGFTDMFEQVFTDLGGEIVLSEKITKGETDMKPVLTAVAESGAEILFFPIFHPDGTLIVQQRKDVPGMEKITLISADALRVEPFLDEAGDDAVGVYFVGGAIAKETEVATEYEAKYNEPPQHATYGSTYDSVHLLLPVVEQVAIKDADGTLHIGRQALRDAMYAVPDYEGVTGTLSCDQFGDCGVNRFEVVQVDDPSTGLEGLKANVIYTYASE